MSLSLDEFFDFTGTEAETLSGELYFLKLTSPCHRIDCLHFETEHGCDLFRFEQLSFLMHLNHSGTIEDCLGLSLQVRQTRRTDGMVSERTMRGVYDL